LAGGKWNHMMDQTHIGYTNWQEPPKNNMPRVTEVTAPDAAKMGGAVEGSSKAWPGGGDDATLPAMDAFNRQRRYVDVFDKGKSPFEFSATASAPWIVLDKAKGNVEKEQRIWVSVDWTKAPAGSASGTVKIAGAGDSVTVKVDEFNPSEVKRATLDGFVEANGYVSMEASHYTKRVDKPAAKWALVPDLGRTGSAMTILPSTAASVLPVEGSPTLEYKMYLFSAGKAEVNAILSPSLNFSPDRGLSIAVSLDSGAPQVVEIVPKGYVAGDRNRDWEESVKNEARTVKATLDVAKPGYHVLKVWMVDPGVALQKIVVNMGGLKPSYLGPPESFRNAVARPAPASAEKKGE